MRRGAAVLALWLLAGAANALEPEPVGGASAPTVAAEAAPTIVSINFEGNDTTQPRTMLREIVVEAGDPADPALIERSRQAIQDLGLFRSVDVRQTPVPGGIAVTFVVEEKWYILPIPRLDANSEGENAYGLSLRWFNVLGLNHTLRGNWTVRDEEKANKGESTSYGVGYGVPFIYDTPWGLGLSGGHSESPITDFGGYDEITESAGIALSRSFATGPASQGFSTSVSLSWSRQDTQGVNAPAPYGQAVALGLSASYRDLRYNLYSEDGITAGATVSGANEGLGSDYSFGRIHGNVARYFRVGETPHQSVHLFAAAGSYHGGPVEYTTYDGVHAIGGASVMRAYPADFRTGDAYYHFAAEYLRPLGVDWLRGLVVLEAGNAFEDASGFNSRVYTSIGLGLRLRLTFLVNVEVEAGVAWPIDGDEQRFFASKV